MIGADTLAPIERAPVGPREPESTVRIVILLVEPEPLVREMLSASLELHDGRFRVVAVATANEALGAARDHRPALLVVDPSIPGAHRQADFVAELRLAAPGAPILGLTATPQRFSPPLPHFEAIVEKPPDVHYLLRRVDDLLAAHTGGVLRGVSLASLLQVLSADRKTCSIAVEATRDAGKIWLARGRPWHALAGPRTGRDAFFHLLSIDDPLLRVRPDAPPTHSLDDTLPALLLEHSVLLDRRHRPV